jgi:hypothetical protein
MGKKEQSALRAVIQTEIPKFVMKQQMTWDGITSKITWACDSSKIKI